MTPVIVLDPPPAYLARLPLAALLTTSPREGKPADPATRILDALRARGIYARPTLAEVEAERARRGLRPTGVEVAS